MLLPLTFILIAVLSSALLIIRTAADRRISEHFSMVLVGGGLADDNDEVWNKIIELGK